MSTRSGTVHLVYSGEQELLLSLSYDSTMKVWDMSGPEPDCVSETSLPVDVWPRSCAFSGSSDVVFGTFGSCYRTYDHTAGVWRDEDVQITHGINGVGRAATPARGGSTATAAWPKPAACATSSRRSGRPSSPADSSARL